MAEALFLRRLLRPRPTAATAATAAAFLKPNYFSTAASAAVNDENVKLTEKSEEKKEGKWVILPPFSPTVNGSLLGRKISRGGRILEEEVRRDCLEGEGADSGAKPQEFRLKRVGEKDMMNQGERIFLPLSVQGSPIKKPGYQCNDQDMHFTRSLELYKDSAIIVINKPPKLSVQGGLGIKKSVDELAGAYLRYDNEEPPRLVHRLDQDSSGILVMGRTRTSATVLHSIFREKTVCGLDDIEIDWKKRVLHKRYLALVFGVPDQSSGVVSAPLAKVVVDDGKSERITVVDSRSPSQHAMTEYKVIQTSSYGYTWLELAPITGRKHQLRVHCAEVLGTPIVGDYKYGWQAHRNWKPILLKTPSHNGELGEVKSNNLGRDFECGSIAEKQPHLHLHCKQLILPNISAALENVSFDSEYDFSKLENLNLIAPLPSHMQRSWNLLNSLPDHQGY
ncbi:hypothetical protein KSS87_014591 [Heliosperma pusillum]|nr:hypothetical protein KSS87_014591 [Heliosperma pusillum]